MYDVESNKYSVDCVSGDIQIDLDSRFVSTLGTFKFRIFNYSVSDLEVDKGWSLESINEKSKIWGIVNVWDECTKEWLFFN